MWGPAQSFRVSSSWTFRVDQVDQVPEGPHRVPFDADRPSVRRLGMTELSHDVVDHHRVLRTLVLGIGEQEDHQVLVAELGQGPEERRQVGTAAHISHRPIGSGPGRGEETYRSERLRRKLQGPIQTLGVLVEVGVAPIEMKEVLALHVEDECLGVDRGRAKHSGGEERVEEKGGVAGLGGDT